MIRLILPIIFYIIGYVISHYTLFEIKSKESIFERLTFALIIALIITAIYYSIENNAVQIIILFLVSLLIFLIMLPKDVLKESELTLKSALIGLIIGSYYSNFLIIIFSCAFFFFKSSYDYLTKKVLFNSLSNLMITLLSSVIALALNTNLLAVIGCAGLLRMLRR